MPNMFLSRRSGSVSEPSLNRFKYIINKGLHFHSFSVIIPMFERTGSKYSSLAQSAEHAAVNRSVVGSSPTGGARKKRSDLSVPLLFFCFSTGHVFQRSMKLDFISADILPPFFSEPCFSTSRAAWFHFHRYFAPVFNEPCFSTSHAALFHFHRYFAAAFLRSMRLIFTSQMFCCLFSALYAFYIFRFGFPFHLRICFRLFSDFAFRIFSDGQNALRNILRNALQNDLQNVLQNVLRNVLMYKCINKQDRARNGCDPAMNHFMFIYVLL